VSNDGKTGRGSDAAGLQLSTASNKQLAAPAASTAAAAAAAAAAYWSLVALRDTEIGQYCAAVLVMGPIYGYRNAIMETVRTLCAK